MTAFDDLVLPLDLIQKLGPALCSGRSLLLHGPPGNGKSRIAQGLGRFLSTSGGEIYVPYAVQVDNSIVTLFDPAIHKTTDDDETHAKGESLDQLGHAEIATNDLPDTRWRRIRRPVVITGGELTLEMLDLRQGRSTTYYTAPLHIKANGGLFLVDDFGRQLVGPRQLLNRWILPLEERVDHFTLNTGRKFAVPFEQVTVFSTNFSPRELLDDAFLRRLRHKIRVQAPDRERFVRIFERLCRTRTVEFDPCAVDLLFSQYYDRGRPPRASDPRDLLEIVQSICRFRKQCVGLTPELVGEAAQQHFCHLDDGMAQHVA